MSQTQTIQHDNMLISLPYPFLSQPPKNKQKRRAAPAPDAPLPSPPPPSPKSKISMWSQKVAPGPPAPRSPFNASPLAQVHIVKTPSTAGSAALHDHRVDLASVGYASMFVSFAAGPQSARLVPPTPAPKAPAALRPRSKSTSHAKPKPAAARAKKHLPPPASTDAALIQLLDGGAAPLALRVPDEAEALEYAPLISAGMRASAGAAWVRFSARSGLDLDLDLDLEGAGDEKRGSVDSDLRSAYRVLPRELDPAVPTSLPAALSRSRNILALPARGGGVEKHLRKPLYLAEIELAFPKTPTSPSMPATPKSPRSIRGGGARARRNSGKGRKGGRPAPLDLAPQSPRGEFLSDSFAPSPRRSPRRVRVPVPASPAPARKNSESSDATLCAPGGLRSSFDDSDGEGLVKAGTVWEREEARRGALRKKPSMALKGMRRMFGRA
ncbi:hypothetical protein FIBSPDRAFT_927477 [Athelia psychrophila]|uniref:Uncharacterized protein n=1 Tax=Athelia psychrophila TaxID=1759441 RepID=A0A166RW55_9AGAM|nr:hypothetical protein FIBSPDRAFT_927477 [Fibularhizoctonia sp. CBS 109695]